MCIRDSRNCGCDNYPQSPKYFERLPYVKDWPTKGRNSLFSSGRSTLALTSYWHCRLTLPKNELSTIQGSANYYLSFKNSYLQEILKFDNSEHSLLLSSMPIKSQSDSTHIISLPQDKQRLYQNILVNEDVRNSVLTFNGVPIYKLKYRDDPVVLHISSFERGPEPGIYSGLCCGSCQIVHNELGIGFLDCICYFYIGGCGFRCGAWL